MIGEYCKEYRKSKDITLVHLGEMCSINYKTLSAFENGRSSNIRHLAPYVLLAESYGDKQKFINGLSENL